MSLLVSQYSEHNSAVRIYPHYITARASYAVMDCLPAVWVQVKLRSVWDGYCDISMSAAAAAIVLHTSTCRLQANRWLYTSTVWCCHLALYCWRRIILYISVWPVRIKLYAAPVGICMSCHNSISICVRKLSVSKTSSDIGDSTCTER